MRRLVGRLLGDRRVVGGFLLGAAASDCNVWTGMAE